MEQPIDGQTDRDNTGQVGGRLLRIHPGVAFLARLSSCCRKRALWALALLPAAFRAIEALEARPGGGHAQRRSAPESPLLLSSVPLALAVVPSPSWPLSVLLGPSWAPGPRTNGLCWGAGAFWRPLASRSQDDESGSMAPSRARARPGMDRGACFGSVAGVGGDCCAIRPRSFAPGFSASTAMRASKNRARCQQAAHARLNRGPQDQHR